MTFHCVAKMRMTWLGHSCFGGRKKDMDVVWTAGKGGDLEQVRGRGGGVTMLWLRKWSGKTFRKMIESLTLILHFTLVVAT